MFDFAAEHWLGLETSNLSELDFSSVRLRTQVTNWPGGSKGRGLAMAFKLLEAAQDRWRAVNGSCLERWSAPVATSTRTGL